MEAPVYHLEQVLRGKQDGAEDFVGPLDLILHLLSKNKMEIQDIPLAQILDQYLDWMARRQELDLDIASDFIAMASHLLYIKTRMLVSVRDEEAQTEMELLIADLEQRKREELQARVRMSLDDLEQRYRQSSGAMPTPRKQMERLGRPPLDAHGVQELQRAMARILQRNHGKRPPPVSAFRELVGREPYPVDRKMDELSNRLIKGAVLSFAELLRETENRSELVALFIAVLELCSSGQLRVQEQDDDLLLQQTQERHQNPLGGREDAVD